ncbi:hypothetical protein M413DRAFT_22123 [Hebeloma cylindrosporum]|uniref:ZZ-type domain-containing protein n=1 Tax=Hebeloma cylindrosporum TaxID=76867 RepID=A0A0C3CFD5_HEBCY|nr:hypothetical protein M413DRAFT_22123 [Hebeloma cylindrosporum h7]
MFTIKVTYHGQIRKYTFTDTNHFPSYEQICNQLHRVFSIPQGFYLSKLLFSPDAAQPSRILIGKEVHHAYDYHKCIRQYKDRTWPHGLLRFSVVDDLFSIAAGIHRVSTAPEFAQQSDATRRISMFHIPPAPLIPPTTRSVSSQVPMDVDPTTPTTSNIRPQLPGQAPQPSASAPSLGACCPVSQGRAEVQELLLNFQEGLNRVLESNLESPLVTGPAEGNASLDENSASALPLHLYAPCHIVVCNGCYDKAKPGFCLSTMGPHDMKLATSASAGASDLPIPRLPVPWAPLNPATGPASNSEVTQPPASSSQRPAPEHVVHMGIICDMCGDTVKGVRHKCLDCPDYDLCTTCISGGAAEAHNPFHEFFDVNEPGKVIVHTVFSGNGEREAAGGHSRRPSVPVQPAAVAEPVVHNATCDLCDSRIQGGRYKCLACPDFDTCASCFRITNEQHPLHSFVRIEKVDDYIRARISSNQMHYATCDACNKTIYGHRFKCMHPECPDYDLCEACEALPITVHPPNHPMLKMKTSDTVIPTVYRVGQRTMIPQSSPVEQNSAMDTSTSTHADEDRVKTPTPTTRASDSFSPRVQEERASARVASPGNPPPVPPKPEMISHPSWASIPGFFGPPDVNPFSSSPSITNPFADIPSLPTVAETMEKEITLPSVPKHTPSPWPTTNPAEKQELLQRIAEFSGPITSSEIFSSLEDLQTTARSRHDSPMSFGAPLQPPAPPIPQPPAVSSQKGPANSTGDVPTTDSNENVWSNVSGFSQSLLRRIEKAEEVERGAAQSRGDIALKSLFERLGSEKTDMASNSIDNAERVAREDSPAPPGSFPVPVNLLRDHLSTVGKPRLSKAASVAESTMSDEALLNPPASEVASTVSTRLTLADLISELPSLVPTKAKSTPEPEEKPVETVTLKAAFVEDVTVPDGQVFPPGAEFVKCWRLLNDGGHDWPESTELVFVAGEPLSVEKTQSMTVELGKVSAGAEIDVWTGELKAPDVPGRYVGYWRLKANGELFGNSLWIDINVVESDSHHSAEESMASSSIIMPVPNAASLHASTHVPSETAHSVTESGPASISSIDDSISDAGSDISLISMPSSSDDEDEALWHDTRSQTTAELAAAAAARAAATAGSSAAASPRAPGSTVTAMDYVVLYDDNSSEGSE